MYKLKLKIRNVSEKGPFHLYILFSIHISLYPSTFRLIPPSDPPDRVTLTISPPGNVVRGSSVVLTCHSDASPLVSNNGYSLYREGRFIGLGQNYTIPDVQPDHSGRYHCQARNSISSRGVDHFNSTVALLQVYCMYLDINSTQHISDDDDVTVWDPVLLPDVPENISITINPARVVWGSSVNLTCSSDANPPADTYIWYRNTNSSGSNGLQVGSGPVLSISSMEALHSGLYLCQARNQLGEKNSTEVLLAMVDEEQWGLCLVEFAKIIRLKWLNGDMCDLLRQPDAPGCGRSGTRSHRSSCGRPLFVLVSQSLMKMQHFSPLKCHFYCFSFSGRCVTFFFVQNCHMWANPHFPYQVKWQISLWCDQFLIRAFRNLFSFHLQMS